MESTNPYRNFTNRMQEFMDSFYPITMAAEIERNPKYPPKLDFTVPSGTFVVEEKYFTSPQEKCVIEMMKNVIWTPEGYNLGWPYFGRLDRVFYVIAENMEAIEPREIWSINVQTLRDNMKDIFFVPEAYELKVWGKQEMKKSLNLLIDWEFLKQMKAAAKLL